MPEPERQCSLLDELHQRQDEVLLELDQLNGRIEELLESCSLDRQTEEPVEVEECEAPIHRAAAA